MQTSLPATSPVRQLNGWNQGSHDPPPPLAAASCGGGERLFSHSFMKSEAVFLRLLGVRRLRTGGRSSSSLFGGDGAEGEVGCWLRRRLVEGFFLLLGGGALLACRRK